MTDKEAKYDKHSIAIVYTQLLKQVHTIALVRQFTLTQVRSSGVGNSLDT